MGKLKKLEELSIDLQRQLVGGESLTGSCYCSCSCNCDCDCSCACTTYTYAQSGTDRSGTNSHYRINKSTNRRDRTSKSYRDGRNREFHYANR